MSKKSDGGGSTLYYGDNLDIMRRYLADESVDLIYADPPFNSNRNYNVLFEEKDGSRAASQILAFEDTWTWDAGAEETYADIVTRGDKVSDALEAFRKFLGPCDMLAYLVSMAPRLVECRRVLKESGSMYLHCDPGVAHYLKIVLDAVFGPDRFVNQVTWKRTHSHGNVGRNFGSICDVLLVFSKSHEYFWCQQFTDLNPGYVEKYYRFADPDGRRWRPVTLRNPGVRPNLHYPFTAANGITYHPHPNGWAWTQDRLRRADLEGRLVYPRKPGGALMLKQYLDESKGVRLQNLWEDIRPIGALAAERLGYPTQKPILLLERIIASSCPEDGVVLDPFCGCGTTVIAAQKLARRWIGIDITHLAITLIKERLRTTFDDARYEVVGEPVSAEDAAALAASDPYQFQWWALGLVGARPVEGKKGADHGIDGKIIFQGDRKGVFETVVLSVKAGKTDVSHVRDLRGVVEREKAALGVLITMQAPTKPMVKEAAIAGFFSSKFSKQRFQKIQILTIEELLAGKAIAMPPVKQLGATFKKAERVAEPRPKQYSLPGDVED